MTTGAANEERSPDVLIGQARVMAEVYEVLAANERRDAALGTLLLGTRKKGVNDIPDPEPERLFLLHEIRERCVRYRLRFVDASTYRRTLPPRAVHALARTEERVGAPLRGLKVMAASLGPRRTDREVRLFIPLGQGRYYLVHEWGGSPGRMRAWSTWPVRGPRQLAISILCVSLLVALLVPNAWTGAAADAPYWGSARLLMMFRSLMLTAAGAVFAWYIGGGRFSQEGWNTPGRHSR